MGTLYELADSIEEKTVKGKLIILFAVIGFFILTYGGIYYVGTKAGQSVSDSKYLRQRDENLSKIAVYENDAKNAQAIEDNLTGENALLKKQIAASAEILKQNDAKLNGDAKKLDDLEQKRINDDAVINNTTDYNIQLKLMCSNYARSGFSISFCKDVK